MLNRSNKEMLDFLNWMAINYPDKYNPMIIEYGNILKKQKAWRVSYSTRFIIEACGEKDALEKAEIFIDQYVKINARADDIQVELIVDKK